jgi:hypothetical protein
MKACGLLKLIFAVVLLVLLAPKPQAQAAGADWSGINDNWRSIGGVFPHGAPVAATSRNPGNLDLFITGNDGRVYTSWWYAGSDWSGINDNWRSIGGVFPHGAPVAATSRNPDNLDLFITGNDGRVYTSWWPCVECRPLPPPVGGGPPSGGGGVVVGGTGTSPAQPSYTYQCTIQASKIDIEVTGQKFPAGAPVTLGPGLEGLFTTFGQTRMCSNLVPNPPTRSGFAAKPDGTFAGKTDLQVGCMPGCQVTLTVGIAGIASNRIRRPNGGANCGC